MWGREWARALDWIFCLLTGWPNHSNELFPRQSPGMFLQRDFPSNSSQKGLGPPTLTYVLTPHTNVNKTPSHRFTAFKAAEQTWDYFRHFKWRKRKQGKDTPTPTPPQSWFCHQRGTSRVPKDVQGEDGVGMLKRDMPWAAWMWDSPCHSQRGTKPCFVIFNGVDIAFAI